MGGTGRVTCMRASRPINWLHKGLHSYTSTAGPCKMPVRLPSALVAGPCIGAQSGGQAAREVVQPLGTNAVCKPTQDLWPLRYGLYAHALQSTGPCGTSKPRLHGCLRPKIQHAWAALGCVLGPLAQFPALPSCSTGLRLGPTSHNGGFCTHLQEAARPKLRLSQPRVSVRQLASALGWSIPYLQLVLHV